MSKDPRDKRLRTSIALKINGTQLVVDCGPDFRQQMLQNEIHHLDALLVTHEHNDHIIGMDDVRPFNFKQRGEMPIYTIPRVQKELRHRFGYVFATENRYPGAPMIKLHTIDKSTPFEVEKIEVIPIEVIHGRLPILGFRIGKFAYITDMKTIAEEEFKKLLGVQYLVINALRKEEHYSHLTLQQAIEFGGRVGAQKTYLTHVSHRMGLYEEVAKELPQGFILAYDGLQEVIQI
ncbi:MAG: MBL fold metallo-hydrolase [Bacteroidota bacterium]